MSSHPPPLPDVDSGKQKPNESKTPFSSPPPTHPPTLYSFFPWRMKAWAAAIRAPGTRKGEQETESSPRD